MALSRDISERVAVVETKQDVMIMSIESIKVDVKDMHDCLDNTRDGIMQKLEEMKVESNKQHDDLHKKVSEIEKLKDKYTYAAMGMVALAGWASGHVDLILSLIGR